MAHTIFNSYRINDVYTDTTATYIKNESIPEFDKALLNLLKTSGFFNSKFSEKCAILIMTEYRTLANRNVTVSMQWGGLESPRPLYKIDAAKGNMYTFTDYVNPDNSITEPASWSKVIKHAVRKFNANMHDIMLNDAAVAAQ